jgi:methyl-accepting chemotaxis protein
VLDIIAQVAAASEEQSTTAEEISRNIEAISSLAQESASGTQQIAKAAEDLTRLTLNLEGLIDKFQLGDEGLMSRSHHNKNESRHIAHKGHKGYLQ